MKIKQPQQVEKTVGYICDACGSDCYKEAGNIYSTERAKFIAQWGYWSDKDMEVWTCDLCEKCAGRVRDFIEKTMGGKVRVTDGHPFFPPQ